MVLVRIGGAPERVLASGGTSAKEVLAMLAQSLTEAEAQALLDRLGMLHRPVDLPRPVGRPYVR